MRGLDGGLFHLLHDPVARSPALFEAALGLCGGLPLAATVAVLLALWWTDLEGGGEARGVLGGGPPPERPGLVASRGQVTALATAVVLSFIVTRLVAFASDRRRPLEVEALQVPIEAERWGFIRDAMTGFGAFPSDHAALFFALAAGLFSWGPASGWIGLVLAGTICAARVAVGFHYPLDMAVGGIIGAALARLMLAWQARAPASFAVPARIAVRHPAWFYPAIFVVALDFTHHFRLVMKTVFAVTGALVGGRD